MHKNLARLKRVTNYSLSSYIGIAVTSRILHLIVFAALSSSSGTRDLIVDSCRYDCYWYFEIAKIGYTEESQALLTPEDVNWGFFPLFPYLVKILHAVMPWDLKVLGYLVNTVFTVAGTVFLGKYLEERYGSRVSKVTIVLFCFSPVSIYFNAFYTEAGFYCLIAALVWFIYCEKKLAIIITANLLGVTRNTGALVAILLIFAWQLSKGGGKKNFLKASLFSSGSLALLATHILYLQKLSGEFFAVSSHHRVNRGNPFVWAWETLSFHSLLQIGLLVLLSFAIYVFISNLRSRNLYEAVILIPALVTSITYPGFINWRYLLILFPLYLSLSQILVRNNSKIPFRFVVGIEIAILCFVEYSWLMNYGFMV
jgi:hypothetical protein